LQPFVAFIGMPYLEKPVFIGMETIVADFILYPEQDKHRRCHTNGEAADIEKRKPFVAKQVSKSYFPVIPEHDKHGLFLLLDSNRVPVWYRVRNKSIMIDAMAAIVRF
jgi:hypothetical protein